MKVFQYLRQSEKASTPYLLTQYDASNAANLPAKLATDESEHLTFDFHTRHRK